MRISDRLISLSEAAYRDFSAKLLPKDTPILGVRLPVLRKLAASLLKEYPDKDISAFLSETGGYFEEKMLRGMIIGLLQCPDAERILLIDRYLPQIDNWSLCDSFCAGLKSAGTRPEILTDFILSCFHSEEEFRCRFASVMLLDYYIGAEQLPMIFSLAREYTPRGYYADMGLAWLLSVCYARHPDVTFRFLSEASCLPADVRQMTVRKITESSAVSPADKEKARRLRIQKG